MLRAQLAASDSPVVRLASVLVRAGGPISTSSVQGPRIWCNGPALQSRFISQIDLHSASLLRVFEKCSGQQGQNLRDMAAMMTDLTDANTLGAIEGTTVGIYVIRETPNSKVSDVAVIIEGQVALQDLETVALAAAMLFGLFYTLNMSYPSKLRYTFEVIQKLIMELDAAELSRKAQSLKTQMHQ
ncbi:unnamed protein product [Boreogadus saida]